MLETTARARISSPSSSATPTACPDFLAVFQRHADRLALVDDDLRDRRVGPDLAACRLKRPRQRPADCPHAAACVAPGADGAVHFAHVVVQQHVGRARRAGPEAGADDRAAGEMGLDQFGLEILVEKIGDAHGPEPDGVVHPRLAEIAEGAAHLEQAAQVARAQRRGIRRRLHQHRADKAALAHDLGGIAVVGLGVAQRVAGQFPPVHVVVVVAGDVVAIAGHRQPAIVRGDLQPVFRQLQFAHDFRPHQAADVGAVGVGEPRVELTADRGAADIRVALDDQHVEPGPCEIRGGRQAVVARTDHNDVVGFHAPRRPGMALIRASRHRQSSPVPSGASR
jgi:hypothetical protein